MGFEKVVTLFAEKTISLIRDQKSIEGRYLGTTSGPNALNPSKPQQKHFFATETGTIAVWGATNLDIGMAARKPGEYVKATFSHTAKPLKPGRKGMNIFDVYVDNDLFSPIGNLSLVAEGSSESDTVDYSGSDVDDTSDADDSVGNTVGASRQPQSQANSTPSDAAARAQALLARSRAATASGGVKRTG